MSDLSQRIHQLSPKRLALVALDLEERLESLERLRKDPIAIVGMACRFPGGADSPEAFWKLLHDGVDAIREVPAARWDVAALYDPDPDAPGKMSTRWSGFLDECDRFDPDFFGISPREAQSMDPQHRLLLEVTWEALESAGIATDRLHASPTGVFVGICNSDYSQLLMEREREAIDAYLASGNAPSVASGRLSYLLGLQGPSLSVDTACSSSLVAVHLACQSLRSGECRMALAAGVNLILAPEITIALSKAHMMAPDGRCKTFDAAADGFVRGEGCGVVALKRLADARADGDRILALIRGSAANQDGRSSGLTAPNGPSQEAVIGAALAAAGIAAPEVDYVESHGTGTSLGDPIEVRALGAALGPGRPATRPLLIGSVKTNIGHLEAAAGIAGLIKTVLALQHEEIPPHLHFKTPNPHIQWAALPLAITTDRTPWLRGERRRIAGVSSFGFSGTNAHLVVEEAPIADAAANEVERPRHILTVSARARAALVEQASRVAGHLRNSSDSLADVCWSANAGRAHLSHRLALHADSAADAAAILEAFASGETRPELALGEARPEPAEVAFLFTGQGAQYVGMAREVYATQPVFRRALDRCDELLRSELTAPLLDVLFDGETGRGRIDETAFTQPALFAVEYALAELWRSWGVQPSVVMGHSIGEFAAACVAGVMSVEDAARLVAARGRLMQALPAGGAMAAVFAPVATVEPYIAAHRDVVSIAAVNGPDNTVVSGEGAAIDAIREALAGQGIKSQPLAVSHAFHSPLMTPMVEAFRREADKIAFSAPRIAFVSNLTGRMLQAGEVLDSNYWCRHVLAPVQFAESVKTIVDAGYRTFVEIGPSPTLLGMARRVVPDADAAWLPSLRKGKPDWPQLLATLGELYVRGAAVDWVGFDKEYVRKRVSLPTYPFQRQRSWAAERPRVSKRSSAARPGADTGHPLLGERLHSPMPSFEARFDPRTLAVLRDHRVGDALVVPGPVYLEMAAAAASTTLGKDGLTIENLQISEPLVLGEEEARTVQTVVTEAAGGAVSVKVFSAGDGDRWMPHASATVVAALDHTATPALSPKDLDDIRARCVEEIEGSEFYARVLARGVDVGGTLRAVDRIWRRDGEALASLTFPASVLSETAFRLHPAILDAAMLVVGAATAAGDTPDTPTHLHVLSRIDRVRLAPTLSARLNSHVVLRPVSTGGAIVADLQLFDDEGHVSARLDGIRISRVDARILRGTAAGQIDDLMYDVAWRAAGQVELPIRAGDFLPSAADLARAMTPRAATLSEQYGLASFDAFLPTLDRACAGYIVNAFRALGFDFAPGTRGDASPLADRLRVLPRHRRLFDTLLETLAKDGVLAVHAGQWRVLAEPPSIDPDAVCAGLAAQYPSFAAQARITSACGRELAGVLAGDVDPLHLLFPKGSFELTEQLYQHGPFAVAYNTLVQEAIARVASALPAGRTLRCLEIGAGTGGTSAYVLSALPADRTEYWYTDLSPLFMARAADKFRQYPFVRFKLLDIERDPSAQGFERHAFDVVIASNAVHATADLRVAMGHVQQLLAPGGLLVLLEGTEHQRWVDLTFGLLEGWWKFTDRELRPDYPLLAQQAWTTFLERCGFVEVRTIPATKAAQAVIVARSEAASSGSRERSPISERSWLIVADANELVERAKSALNASGATIRAVPARSVSEAAVQTALGQLEGDVEVLYFASNESGGGPAGLAGRITQELSGVAQLVRAVTAGGRAGRTRLWMITSGAQAPLGDDSAVDVRQAPLWGFGRVIALEHPDIWGGLIDLDPRADGAANATMLAQTIVASDVEDQVALRGGARYVPRLVRSRLEPSDRVTLRPDAAYLITGGTGGVAVPLVRWMVEHGAKHVVLTARRALPDRRDWASIPGDHAAQPMLKAIVDAEARGATVETVACDVADRSAMAALFDSFSDTRPPLRGIFHLAAAMSVAAVRDLTEPVIASMLAPKVDGAGVLSDLAESLELDYFVLFSSTTGLWGVAGLAHYAAANEFLDAMACERARKTRPVLSVNWGTWEEMRLASQEERRSFIQAGLHPMPSDAALDRLERLLAAREHRKVVASVDWAVLKPLYEAKRLKPFLHDVGPLPSSRSAASTAQAVGGQKREGVVERLRNAPPARRYEQLVAYLQEQVAAVLGLPASQAIPVGRGLFEMGMDSLMSVELKNRLESGLAHPLPSTLTFNYPNVAALAEFLMRELGLDERATSIEDSPASTVDSVPSARVTDDAEVDAMSEDELAALLSARLGEIR